MDLKLNESFWLIKNGLSATYPSLYENTECEVLNVGGDYIFSVAGIEMVSAWLKAKEYFLSRYFAFGR